MLRFSLEHVVYVKRTIQRRQKPYHRLVVSRPNHSTDQMRPIAANAMKRRGLSECVSVRFLLGGGGRGVVVADTRSLGPFRGGRAACVRQQHLGDEYLTSRCQWAGVERTRALAGVGQYRRMTSRRRRRRRSVGRRRRVACLTTLALADSRTPAERERELDSTDAERTV